MCENKATRTVVVTNVEGLHARAATLIAELVRGFNARVTMTKDRECVESTDVLQVLSLGAGPGSQLLLEAAGSDAEKVLDALVRLFSDNFGER